MSGTCAHEEGNMPYFFAIYIHDFRVVHLHQMFIHTRKSFEWFLIDPGSSILDHQPCKKFHKMIDQVSQGILKAMTWRQANDFTWFWFGPIYGCWCTDQSQRLILGAYESQKLFLEKILTQKNPLFAHIYRENTRKIVIWVYFWIFFSKNLSYYDLPLSGNQPPCVFATFYWLAGWNKLSLGLFTHKSFYWAQNG